MTDDQESDAADPLPAWLSGEGRGFFVAKGEPVNFARPLVGFCEWSLVDGALSRQVAWPDRRAMWPMPLRGSAGSMVRPSPSAAQSVYGCFEPVSWGNGSLPLGYDDTLQTWPGVVVGIVGSGLVTLDAEGFVAEWAVPVAVVERVRATDAWRAELRTAAERCGAAVVPWEMLQRDTGRHGVFIDSETRLRAAQALLRDVCQWEVIHHRDGPAPEVTSKEFHEELTAAIGRATTLLLSATSRAARGSLTRTEATSEGIVGLSHAHQHWTQEGPVSDDQREHYVRAAKARLTASCTGSSAPRPSKTSGHPR